MNQNDVDIEKQKRIIDVLMWVFVAALVVIVSVAAFYIMGFKH